MNFLIKDPHNDIIEPIDYGLNLLCNKYIISCEHLCITMPFYLRDIFRKCIYETFPMTNMPPMEYINAFRGASIQYGYENKVIIHPKKFDMPLDRVENVLQIRIVTDVGLSEKEGAPYTTLKLLVHDK